MSIRGIGRSARPAIEALEGRLVPGAATAFDPTFGRRGVDLPLTDDVLEALAGKPRPHRG